MKLSKSLLQSMVVGLAIGTATSSCQNLFNPLNPNTGINGHSATCDENCTSNHLEANPDWENCPACGMG